MQFAAAGEGMGVGRLIGYSVVTVIALTSAMLVHRVRNRARARLTALAKALEFTLVEPRSSAAAGGLPRVVGKRNGRTVDVYTVIREGRHHSEKRSVVAMIVRNPHQLRFELGARSLMGSTAMFDSDRAVVTGDANFDRDFQIRASDPTFVAAALLPEVRQRIVRTWNQDTCGRLAVEVGEIRYEEGGTFEDALSTKRVQALIELFGDLAEIIEACFERAGAAALTAGRR